MAKHSPQSHDQPLQEEDYIDMDLSSPPPAAEAATTTASLFCYNTAMAASPQNSREFEFHMSAPLDQWEPTASPADELFYKGKLLPLHLPPRIQMVRKLLESAAEKGLLLARTAPATPYQSCNVSAANSCYVSGELNAEHYFHECISVGIDAEKEVAACEKKPWSKKLKFIRHLNLGLKLKASKAYLKTIFTTKGGNPDDKNGTPRANELSNAQFKTCRKNPFGYIRSNRYIASPVSNSTTLGGKLKEDECGHRRSFSSVIIRYSSSNKTSSVSSSSCSSSNSSSFSIPSSNDSGVGPVLRRSSSASSEMDNPIQGAIAYCKKSQQLASVRKSASDAGFRFMSSSASKIAAESEEAEDIIEISQNINVNSMPPNNSVLF
ncbi:probable membrane-associated kinase regulator 4 [Phragmites australis]|uniref:probable membrane-associated kinase regulator 4 n=1 Tax=Phragmites australis TaxID=29695 RepID=UPI002D764C34|nr:probable membrane-associated kinase regulator 4 [Phragmites australis]